MFDIKKLERAIGRNLSIYDADAPLGEFTLRHLALMRISGRNYFRNHDESFNSVARLKRVWLPKEIYDSIQEQCLENDEPHDNIYGEDAGYFSPEAETVLEKIKNSFLCSGDKYFCVAEYDNGEYLLGSF